MSQNNTDNNNKPVKTELYQNNTTDIILDWSDLPDMSAQTLDLLVMCASGLNSTDIADMLNVKYNTTHKPPHIRAMKHKHKELYQVIKTRYYDTFLRQRLSGVVEGLLQRISGALSKVPIDSANDLRSIVTCCTAMISAQKELAGGNKGDNPGQVAGMKQVESLLDRLSGSNPCIIPSSAPTPVMSTIPSDS